MKKIIFALGIYDTTDLFSHFLIEAFEKQNYECVTLDLNDMKGTVACLKKLNTSEIEAAVVFNNLLYSIELEENENFWEKEKIPYINILMDHPFHYAKQLKQMPDTAIVLCTDKNHVTFLNRYMESLKKVSFLPHAGAYLSKKKKMMEERSIPILYAGSLPFEAASLLIPDLSAETKFDALDLSKTVLEQLILAPDQTTEEAILRYLKTKEIHLSLEEEFEVIYKMRFLDSYATSYFREQTVRVLVEQGFDVTVYGSGWENCEWTKNPHFKHKNKVFAPEILPLMEDSQIVLSTQTWYKNGAHDRIYNGMLAGSCVLSDTSTYLSETLKDGREIVFFEREKLEELPIKVEELFCNKPYMQKIADAGYAHALHNDTWEERAKELLAILKEANR